MIDFSTAHEIFHQSTESGFILPTKAKTLGKVRENPIHVARPNRFRHLLKFSGDFLAAGFDEAIEEKVNAAEGGDYSKNDRWQSKPSLLGKCCLATLPSLSKERESRSSPDR